MLMLREEYSFQFYMNTLCLWLNDFGFNYIIKRNNDTEVCKIYFDMERKWSLFSKLGWNLYLSIVR